jgi:hypothetical protein
MNLNSIRRIYFKETYIQKNKECSTKINKTKNMILIHQH